MNGALTRERLAEIRGRLEFITPGEWFADGTCNEGEYAIRVDEDEEEGPTRLIAVTFDEDMDGELPGEPNAEFIAHAAQDIPALLAHVEALETELQELRKARP